MTATVPISSRYHSLQYLAHRRRLIIPSPSDGDRFQHGPTLL